MTEFDPEEVSHLRELSEKASEGPWTVNAWDSDGMSRTCIGTPSTHFRRVLDGKNAAQDLADAHFIVATTRFIRKHILGSL